MAQYEPERDTRGRAEDLDKRIAWLRQRADKLARGDRTTAHDAALAAQMLRSAGARSREAHNQAANACERAAVAHDRAAVVLDRLADAGVGDVAERRKAAERHRELAAADRERAAAERAQATSPEDGSAPVGG